MCGRLVAGRRPDVFARRMASQTFSRASGRRQAARLLRMAKGFTNHTPNGKASTFAPPNEAPNSEKIGAAEGAAKGQPGCTRGQSLGKSGAAGKGVNSPNLRKKRGSQSDQADFYNTKKEPRNVKVSPPTALAPAPARRPHRFRILLRRSAQAVGVQQRTVFKRRNALAIRCRARQVVVVRRARETHAGKINDLISAAVQLSSRGKKLFFQPGGRANARN